jgi:NAD(P)-dependent dehydrogenase (short-subunit alcohol dehydrogenase family)
MPFGPTTTAAEVIDGVDLTGRRAVVTGGASGIGLVTARALAGAGAQVTLAVRDTAAGDRAAAGSTMTVAPLDLADRASFDTFAAGWTGPLDILVDNAGVMALPELTRTPRGWETQFSVNHLGHAALTLGLHGALTAAGDARVVVVSSSAHLLAPVDFDDLMFERRPYEAWTAYGQSKTAMILFAVALAGHWRADGITVNALHPGGIMTNLQRHLDDDQLAFVGAKGERGETLAVPPGWKTPEQGAATSVLLAASPTVAGVTGRYFDDATAVEPGPKLAPYAIDPETAGRLWAVTRQLLA